VEGKENPFENLSSCSKEEGRVLAIEKKKELPSWIGG